MLNPFTAIFCGVAIGFSIVGAHARLEQLDRDTRIQCATQDWPAHQHQAHVEFCKAYWPYR